MYIYIYTSTSKVIDEDSVGADKSILSQRCFFTPSLYRYLLRFLLQNMTQKANVDGGNQANTACAILHIWWQSWRALRLSHGSYLEYAIENQRLFWWIAWKFKQEETILHWPRICYRRSGNWQQASYTIFMYIFLNLRAVVNDVSHKKQRKYFCLLRCTATKSIATARIHTHTYTLAQKQNGMNIFWLDASELPMKMWLCGLAVTKSTFLRLYK